MQNQVVVVNDCAHVMEDLMPFLPYNIKFLKRIRSCTSKTFGICWNILRSNGKLFHVNYALQDAWLVQKFKHLDILHCHGSDVRWTLHSKKYGWIVKSNLKNARKVLYATPDLENVVTKFRPDAIYLPTPVDIDRFRKKQKYVSEKPRAIYFKLPYENVPQEVISTLKNNGWQLDVKDKIVPYDVMPNILGQHDAFVDRFTIPSFSKTCLEAMASGVPTIDYRHIGNIQDRVAELSELDARRRIGCENRVFVEKNHSVKNVAAMLSRIYDSEFN